MRRTWLLASLLLLTVSATARAETPAWLLTFPHQTGATERVSATPDGAAWAVIDHSRIMHSDNAGLAWTPVNPVPFSGSPTDGLPLAGPTAGGSSEFYVAGQSSATALAANGDRVSRTDDAGTTWRPVVVPRVVSGPALVGAQYLTRTQGRFWLAQDGFTIVASCARLLSTTPLLASADGRRWTRSDIPLPSGTVLGLDFLDGVHGAASVIDYDWKASNAGGSCGFTGSSSSSVVFTTDDGGRHWRRAYRCARACYGLTWASGRRLVLGQWDGTVLDSRDLGRRFTVRAHLPVLSGILGLQSMDCVGSRCWALVNGTGIFRQDRYGEWVHETSDADAPGLCLVSLSAIDEQRVVAAGPHGLMARVPLPAMRRAVQEPDGTAGLSPVRRVSLLWPG